MIEPKVTDMVLFYSPGEPEPRAAIIAKVYSHICVNLCVITPHGGTQGLAEITLIQPGIPIPGGPHCRWTDDQIREASKTEGESEKTAEVVAPVAGDWRQRRIRADP